MIAFATTHITLFQFKTCHVPLTNQASRQREKPPEGGSPHSDADGTCQKPPTNIRAYHSRSRDPPRPPRHAPDDTINTRLVISNLNSRASV